MFPHTVDLETAGNYWRMWYWLGYGAWGTKPNDGKVNHCRFFWRGVFGGLGVLVFVLMGLGVLAIVCPVAILFAYRPSVTDPGQELVAPIRNWPRLWGHRIWPLTLIIFGLSIWCGLYWLIAGPNPEAVIFTVLGVTVALVFIILHFCRWWRKAWWNFWSERTERKQWEEIRSYTMPDAAPKPPSPWKLWLKAKKEKFCPFIEFTRDGKNVSEL